MNRTPTLLALPSIAVLLALSGCASSDTATVSSSAPSADTVDIQALPPLEGADENGEYDPDEALLLTGRCMQEAGMDAHIDVAQGSVTYSATGDAAVEEQAEALDECSAKFPISDPTEDWSDVVWRSIYDAEVRAAECYAAQGLAVGEIPTFEQFRETYPTDSAWSASQALGEMDQVESYQLAKTCPSPGQVGNEITGEEPVENVL